MEYARNNISPFNILIIGTGMYVCGRGTDGYGTILPAIYEWKRNGFSGEVYIAGWHVEGIAILKRKVIELNRLFGFDITPKYFPAGRLDNKLAYQIAMRQLPKPACATIAVPDNLHSAIAGDCIVNGLHTLVVKPLAPMLREVKKLINLSKENNVYCAVEYHKRLDRANMLLKDTVAKGDLGDLLYILVEYSQRKSIPTVHFRSWAKSTNVFQYLGIHYVDIIYYVTGATPLRAMAVGQKAYLDSRDLDTYDSIQATIEWRLPSGKRFNSCILTNWIDSESTSAMSDQKIKVIGTRGRFESDQKQRGVTLVTDKKGIEEPNPYFCLAYGAAGKTSYHGYGIESVLQFLKDVKNIEEGVSTIVDLEKKRPTFSQSLISTAVLEGVNQSLKNGGEWINIQKMLR